MARHDDDKVDRIDPVDGTESIDVGSAPSEVVAGAGAIWVVVDDGKGLVRINPGTRKVAKRLTVDVKGCDCTVAKLAIAQGVLWSSSALDRSITARDPRNGESQGKYEPGAGFKGAFAVGGGALWAVGTDDTDPATSWLIRIDPDSGKVERIDLGTGSYFTGVAYGEGKVWIADAADAKNTVTVFDPRTEGTTNVEVETGITDDDITVAPGAVLVWEPDDGFLTRIDPGTLEVAKRHRIASYFRHRKLNRTSSDLAVASGSAWVTDPVGGAVYKVDY